MSNRLVFSLFVVSMSILLVWAFRPATPMFTGSSQTIQSDTKLSDANEGDHPTEETAVSGWSRSATNFSHSEPEMSDEQIRPHLHRAAVHPRWDRT